MDVTDLYPEIITPYDPRENPHPPPAQGILDAPLYKICVNIFWWAHVSGVIERLLYTDAWEGTDDEIHDAIDSIGKLLNLGAPISDCEDSMSIQYPQHATLWHDEAIVTHGGAIASGQLSDTYYGIFSYQSSGTNGDSFEQSVVLDAGDYVFHVQGGTTNAHGKIDWSMDAGSPFISGQDWYSSGSVSNVYKTGTLTLATAGRYTLKGTVNGKNASALAYYIPLTKYWFERVP